MQQKLILISIVIIVLAISVNSINAYAYPLHISKNLGDKLEHGGHGFYMRINNTHYLAEYQFNGHEYTIHGFDWYSEEIDNNTN